MHFRIYAIGNCIRRKKKRKTRTQETLAELAYMTDDAQYLARFEIIEPFGLANFN